MTVALPIGDSVHSMESVDHHILSFFPELVSELGGDPDALAQEISPDGSGLGKGHGGTNYRRMVDLVALAAVRLSCPDFGLRLAKRQAGHIRSPLVTLMAGCSTVGEALREASSRCHAHSPAASIWIRTAEDEHCVLVGHDILLDGLRSKEQAIEQILLIASLSIREIAGGLIRPRKVHYRHQPLSAARTYRRYFGCGAAFGRRYDALVFDRRDLAKSTQNPDRESFQVAATRIDDGDYPRASLTLQVRGAVMRSLGTDYCGNLDIAQALNLNVRTLHRQLAAEGTSFQHIKNEVRRDHATFYLERTRLELGVVARRLGFAEQSGLVYFCRKWLSASPSDIRRRARQGADQNFPGNVQNEQV